MRAFRLAYDGTRFRGFQRQPHGDTVEDDLFAALRALDVFSGEKPDGYAAAGRTDAGVSARAQTVGFESPEWLTPRALNPELPEAVRAWAFADAPDGFHATHHAQYREYVYHLHAPELDDDRARAAARRLAGAHDFHNLTTDAKNTERDVSLSLSRDGDYLVFTVRAGGFPRGLVRRLVALVRDVAAGGSFDRVDRVLSSEPLDGPLGVPPAPAHPLALADVGYDLDFTVDDRAAVDCRETFASLAVERRTRARVADSLYSQ
ncbi:tRNA pseudouridine(38-40) synthase TruA [Salarchaeum sp. JOR-1]|uniref:tRNA pseudouridine(38-40) synthase TruA n=1 Tax=Salarchaeum sp. JOR-1 TaxID=2599399 RepID=UPI0011987EF1|nr:tRNA pseudouridine(38-40) synthase TruA [Salarchaeum sp. JOR-1]QDX40492.1 tRNA pseudouridine(38-40) synthase TruA [Salarchaeum sp. JOR-1]